MGTFHFLDWILVYKTSSLENVLSKMLQTILSQLHHRKCEEHRKDEQKRGDFIENSENGRDFVSHVAVHASIPTRLSVITSIPNMVELIERAVRGCAICSLSSKKPSACCVRFVAAATIASFTS